VGTGSSFSGSPSWTTTDTNELVSENQYITPVIRQRVTDLEKTQLED